MASGIASGPWAYTPRQIAGLNKIWEVGKHPLVYEESLTSYPPRFRNKHMISPLSTANKGFYTHKSLFGQRKTRKTRKPCKPCKKTKKVKKNKDSCESISKNRCIEFLQTGGTINPLSGRTIKKDGPVYRTLVQKCAKYNLLPTNEQKMSVSAAPLKTSRSIGVGNNRTYSDIGVGGNRTYSDIGVGGNIRPTMVSGGTDPIFIGSLPEPPDERTPVRRSPRTTSGALRRTSSKTDKVTSSSFKINFNDDPKFITIGTNRFEKGSDAKIYEDGRTGKILKIGPKQIVMWNNETGKERHLTHKDFLKFNK